MNQKRVAAACGLSMLLAAGVGCGPRPETVPDHQNLQLSFEQRATDLVARMTLEEKVAQMGNDAPAIERLGIDAYEWWNEALHGVARAGAATVFPQAIGLAATFDTALMHEVAQVISDEGRAKHHEFARRDQRRRYQGLTFWSPNVNIFRDPRWGRGQETYGEDPLLTARMGVEFVRGLQGDHPKYRKVDATAKHFAVHSGPEATRHEVDVHPPLRDFHETYLPAFEALIKEGEVAAVMGAYNRVYGESASASTLLLQDILRQQWKFQGYVVSDCDSIADIYQHHRIVETAAEAAALGVKNGTDLDCGRTYDALLPAHEQGLISEAEIDTALIRLMTARMRLGMFDPVEQVPHAALPYSVNQAPAHDELAHRAAQSSIVLLKNDGLLPLATDLKRVAVVGPTADEVMALLGNYYGTPAAPVTVLEGIRNALPATEVIYERGTDLVPGRAEPRAASLIESSYLRPAADAAERGLLGEYFSGREPTGEPSFSRLDARIGFRWDRGSPSDELVARGELPAEQGVPNDNFSARWSGVVLPPVTGEYEFVVAANDGARLYVDDELVIDGWQLNERLHSLTAKVKLAAGQAHALRLEYFDAERDAEVRLAWRLPGAGDPFRAAVAAARRADAVVFVGGLTGDVEGEEMTVNYPGFAGGDRTDLKLPQTQQKLLEALHVTGKPVVLVLTGGSALAVDWAQRHLPGIVMAWYPGQRGGDAVADVLFGKANPAGRLPVTFYKQDEQLPPFEDYSMQGRTYRYFGGTPLYAFGHGLSYTRFEYSDLQLDRATAGASDEVNVRVTVRNAGDRAGDEVVQLYVRPQTPLRPRASQELRGFSRVHLQPGESRELDFTLRATTDMRHYDEEQGGYAVDGGEYAVQVGASSADIRMSQSLHITVD